MNFKLPKLPYAMDALEPHLSKNTLNFHYLKHHQKYVDMTNKLTEGTSYANLPLEEVIVETSRKKEDQKIFNNAAQAWNHTFYWNSMTPEKPVKLNEKLLESIEESFASMESLEQQFKKEAAAIFGSGWMWLIKDEHGALDLMATKDGDTPFVHHKTPLLACDVWEHAYYLDYQNERPKYLDNFWKVINWKFVENNFQQEIFSPEGRVLLSEDFMKGSNSSLNLGYQ